MNYHDIQIVLQEVPGEISICFSIVGCKMHCLGCHSPYLWKEGSGELLTEEKYLEVLEKYRGFATCVLFMGGEWHVKELVSLLRIAKELGYKTCLYTGQKSVTEHITQELTWIKTGKWDKTVGGLDKKKTNQRFTDIKTNKNLNHLFNLQTK